MSGFEGMSKKEKEFYHLNVANEAYKQSSTIQRTMNGIIESNNDAFERASKESLDLNGEDGRFEAFVPYEYDMEGIFIAWLVTEKGMSFADVANLDRQDERYTKYATEFDDLISNSVFIKYKDGFITWDNKPQNSAFYANILNKAIQKLDKFVVPDVDYTDPQQAQKAFTEVDMAHSVLHAVRRFKPEFDQGFPYYANISIEDKEELVANIEAKGLADVKKAFYEGIENSPEELDNYLKHIDSKLFRVKDAMTSCYGETKLKPLEVKVARNILNSVRGKSIPDAGDSVANINDEAKKIAAKVEAQHLFSEKRILDSLAGGEDKFLDEAVKSENADRFGYNFKSKAETLKYKVNTDYKLDNYKKIAKEKNDNFKLMAEIEGDAINNTISQYASSKDFDIKTRDTLHSIHSSFNSIIKSFEALQKETDMIPEGSKKLYRGVYPCLYDEHANEKGEKSTTDYYNSMLRDFEKLDSLMKDLKDSEVEIPAGLQDALDRLDVVREQDKEFVDSLYDYNKGMTTLGYAKNEFVKNNPGIAKAREDYKNMVDNWQNAQSEAKAKDKNYEVKPLTPAVLKELSAKAEAKREINGPKTGKGLLMHYNAKKEIERIKGVVKEKGDLSFDQFTQILSLRFTANAVRGKGYTLDKNLNAMAVNVNADKFKENYLIKRFFEDAKANPKNWEKLMKAVDKGHCGTVEQMISNYSNRIPLSKLTTDDITMHYLPTCKERIEYWQDAVKNGYSKYATAAGEIMIMRNLAEAERGNKSSLDKKITTEMIADGAAQEELLIGNKSFSDVISDSVFTKEKMKSLITSGHGGEMSEALREVLPGFKGFTHNKTKEVIFKNTLQGKIKSINTDILNCEIVAKDLFKEVEAGRVDRKVADRQLLENFKPLVAKSVVASRMLEKQTDKKGNVSFTKDFSVKKFNEQVNKLMQSPNFDKNFLEMMKPDMKPKSFDLVSIGQQYKAVEDSMKKQPKKPDLEKKAEGVGPIMGGM